MERIADSAVILCLHWTWSSRYRNYLMRIDSRPLPPVVVVASGFPSTRFFCLIGQPFHHDVADCVEGVSPHRCRSRWEAHLWRLADRAADGRVHKPTFHLRALYVEAFYWPRFLHRPYVPHLMETISANAPPARARIYDLRWPSTVRGDIGEVNGVNMHVVRRGGERWLMHVCVGVLLT